uniref:G_PROTEIN_RECEP_F1_2 domain-containing protein n=1 Tax=Rhabditophanes sp. KR3021 TaxID=114890 RepID=A0AC35TNA7_9BILA
MIYTFYALRETFRHADVFLISKNLIAADIFKNCAILGVVIPLTFFRAKPFTDDYMHSLLYHILCELETLNYNATVSLVFFQTVERFSIFYFRQSTQFKHRNVVIVYSSIVLLDIFTFLKNKMMPRTFTTRTTISQMQAKIFTIVAGQTNIESITKSNLISNERQFSIEKIIFFQAFFTNKRVVIPLTLITDDSFAKEYKSTFVYRVLCECDTLNYNVGVFLMMFLAIDRFSIFYFTTCANWNRKNVIYAYCGLAWVYGVAITTINLQVGLFKEFECSGIYLYYQSRSKTSFGESYSIFSNLFSTVLPITLIFLYILAFIKVKMYTQNNKVRVKVVPKKTIVDVTKVKPIRTVSAGFKTKAEDFETNVMTKLSSVQKKFSYERTILFQGTMLCFIYTIECAVFRYGSFFVSIIGSEDEMYWGAFVMCLVIFHNCVNPIALLLFNSTFQIVTFIIYFGIALIMFFNIGSEETNPAYSSFPAHFLANCIFDFIVCFNLTMLIQLPKWGYLIQYYSDFPWVAFAYDGFVYSSILLSIFGNLIIVVNRYYSLIHGITYKTKWTGKICFLIVIIQFVASFFLFFHTYFYEANFLPSDDLTYYAFQVVDWDITKIDRSVMIAVSVTLVQGIALYAVISYNQDLKYALTISLVYLIPSTISFHPYLMLFANDDLKNLIGCMARKISKEKTTISERTNTIRQRPMEKLG